MSAPRFMQMFYSDVRYWKKYAALRTHACRVDTRVDAWNRLLEIMTPANTVSALDTKPASVSKRSAARWWLVAPTLIVFVIVNQVDKTNISVLIADPRFLSDLHLTGQPSRIGFLSSAFFYAYGASLIIWGFMVDRFGPQRCAVAGVIGWSLTTAWCAVAGSVSGNEIAPLALGLAGGCIWAVFHSYVGRWFAVREHCPIPAFW